MVRPRCLTGASGQDRSFTARKTPHRSGVVRDYQWQSSEGENVPAPLREDKDYGCFTFLFQTTRVAIAAPAVSRANTDSSGIAPARTAAGAKIRIEARRIENFILCSSFFILRTKVRRSSNCANSIWFSAKQQVACKVNFVPHSPVNSVDKRRPGLCDWGLFGRMCG